MSQAIDLKALEKKAFRSTFQDGLWDIYLGFLLLLMGGAPLVTSLGLERASWILAVDVALVVLACIAFWAVKKLITVPRIGQVRLGPVGRARQRRTSLVLFLSVVVGMALFATVLVARNERTGGAPLDLLVPGVWAANVLLVFGLGAYFLDFARLYLYGILYAVPVPLWLLVSRWTDVDLGLVAFAVPAGIMILTGFVALVRFLRDYPVPKEVGDVSDR